MNSPVASSTPPRASFWRRHGAKLIASAVITVSMVYMLRKGGLKFIPEGGSFGQVRWWTLAAYLGTLVVMSYFRAVRWRFLLRSFADVPRRQILAVSWIGFAAILVMPFRIGELVRPYMIRSRQAGAGRTPISMSAATGTIVAERVVDGLYLSALLAVALITVPHVVPLPARVIGLPISVEAVRRAGFTMLGVFATAFLVIAIYYVARDLARRLTLSIVGVVSKPLAVRLAGMAEQLADGLRFLGRARDALPFLLETTVYWITNALGMWLLAWGCGVVHADGSPPTFGETLALMGMLGVTILIPGPPGLLGVFQAGIYAGMTMYYPTEVVTSAGAAFVFLLYVIQLAWTVLAGAAFLVGDRGKLQALEEAEGMVSVAPERA